MFFLCASGYFFSSFTVYLSSSKYVSGMQKDLFFCRLPNGIYKITSDANDEQKWV